MASFVHSIFQMMRSKETEIQQPISKEGVQRIHSSHANGSRTNEGNFMNSYKNWHYSKIYRYSENIIIQSKLLLISNYVMNVSCWFS